MDPAEQNSCWKGHQEQPFAAFRDPEMGEEVQKNYKLILKNNIQEEVAKISYRIPEVAGKLTEDNQEDSTNPDDDGNADENSAEVFGNVKIVEAGGNNLLDNNHPDMEDNLAGTPCDVRPWEVEAAGEEQDSLRSLTFLLVRRCFQMEVAGL